MLEAARKGSTFNDRTGNNFLSRDVEATTQLAIFEAALGTSNPERQVTVSRRWPWMTNVLRFIAVKQDTALCPDDDS